jgi:REP element-mobilizing transposase RayT
VLVAAERYRTGEAATLAKIRDVALRVCVKKGYAASTLAVLPDHLHLALRGAAVQSPEEIALSFLNNLSYALGQRRWWQAGYYAGTFGEYGMAAIRPLDGGAPAVRF